MINVEKSGGVAVVTFNRGERRNALSLHAIQELTKTAESFRDDADVSCVVPLAPIASFPPG
jgi:enoyl-CoA hydratase/carnithine racemase